MFYSVIVLHFFFFATTCGLWDLASRAGGRAEAPVVGAPSPNHWTNREPQTPGNIHRSKVSRRSSSQHQDPALPNSLQTPVLEASGKTTSKTGTQSHLILKLRAKEKKDFPGEWACKSHSSSDKGKQRLVYRTLITLAHRKSLHHNLSHFWARTILHMG